MKRYSQIHERGVALDTAMAMSRRKVMAGGTSLGAMLFPLSGWAQGTSGIIHSYEPPRQLPHVEHQTVYKNDSRYTGWTYVIGFWDMRDGELLQSVFSVPADYSSLEAINQDNLRRDLGEVYSFRSKDYGRTWSGPTVNIQGNIDPSWEDAKVLTDLGPIDYRDSNVLVANSTMGLFGGPTSQTSVRISRDRGHSWSPAFPVPLDGLPNHSGMNSFLVRPDGTAMLWLMESGEEGWNRHPLVFAQTPGSDDFHFLSMITPLHDPKGASDSGDHSTTLRFGSHRWFYPRGWMLPNGRILCCLRSQRDPRGVMWTEIWNSDDGGLTWDFLSRVNEFGAPGSLVIMPDGRVVCIYGYRIAPYGIRARVSEDSGATWGPELIIRDDGGSWDLGYPNAWLMDDGRIGTIYWFNSKDDPIQADGGVRHIARTIFSLD